jgi:hypothetical protein
MVEILAPGEATVAVNGIEVGRGRWYSDTLKPGQYVLSASVRALTRCGSARDVDTIYVSATGDTSVTLRPRPCGYLALTSTPEVADFFVMTPNGANVKTGLLPLPDSVMLPVGPYKLRVRARFCSDYNDSVRIESGQTTRQKIPLMCADSTAGRTS